MSKPEYHIEPREAVMLIVDLQKAFGIGDAPVHVPYVQKVIENVTRAAKAWKACGGRIIATRHVYTHPSEVGRIQDHIPPIGQIMADTSVWSEFHNSTFDLATMSDLVLPKTEFNAFHNTKLERILLEWSKKTIITCGLTTPICVEGTGRGGHERGFQIIILEDACASQAMGVETAEQAHRSAIGRMSYVFSQIMTTSAFLGRLTA